MSEEHNIYGYGNGIRLVHKQVSNTRIVHCGFILDIGSRDERDFQQGLAHFWEHMAFKGTRKRKAFHIINRLESVGGELNAFTTKEKMSFYASVLEDHFDKAVELLTDITFHSTFPEKQIDRERQVILDEIAMYDDSPEDALQDEFDEVIYGDHPLGRNILGTTGTLNKFGRLDFKDFLDQNLNTDRIVFSVIGNLSMKKVRKITDKYLSAVDTYQGGNRRYAPSVNLGEKINKNKRFGRAYCAIGRDAYPLTDEKRYPFFMLTNILGGPGMNSRLNLTLREKFGYVYMIDAAYHGFMDSGMAGIYFGTEKRYLNKSIKLVLKELKRLREDRLGTVQLHNAKQQIKGQMAMAEENNTNLMLMIGRSLLDLGKIDTLEEVFLRIDRIASSDILEVANEIFQENKLNYLTFQPD